MHQIQSGHKSRKIELLAFDHACFPVGSIIHQQKSFIIFPWGILEAKLILHRKVMTRGTLFGLNPTPSHLAASASL